MKKVISQNQSGAPVVVLVRPQMAENVGMVARAMMNCGLGELRLVAPREDHLSSAAVLAASGAHVILEQACVFNYLADAVSDCHYVAATTARGRDMTKPVLSPKKAVSCIRDQAAKGQKSAILFGAERTGLENAEVVLADVLVEIPLNPVHASLNLAQAVLLMGYEWWTHDAPDTSRLETGDSCPATKGELNAFLAHLDHVLTTRDYFHFPDKRDRMRRNLYNIFTRSDLTSAEIKTLYGAIEKLITPQ